MIGNKYNYIFLDGSFLLKRNLWVATKDKKIEEMNPGEVVRITIQTINKLYRDWGCSADKVCCIWDEWNRNLDGGSHGYFRSWLIKDYVSYKGSRTWVTEASIKQMKQDPNTTQEDIEKAERELAVNKTQFEAKRVMKEEFKKIGIPSFSWPGYEYDDIATLASFMLHEKTEKPNLIVTKDSDLSYSLCPSCYQFFLPTRGSTPRLVSYDEMYDTIPQVLKDRGVSLYQYHAYCDSLGVTGHNDNLKTIKPRRDGTQAILHILDGNYEDVENVDAFNAQLRSFDLSIFPELDEVKNMIMNDFGTVGSIGNLDVFHKFCQDNKVEKISDDYYMGLVSRFDQKLFSK